MKKNYSVSIIIPNWNGEHLLSKTLSAVTSAAPAAEVIVVDDHSTDGSVALLRKEFPSVKIIEKPSHEGFSGTVNAGAAASSGEIIMLLNTDVRPEKEFLSPLLSHFDDPQVFAVGCLEYSHEHGTIVARGRGIAHWERGWYVHAKGDTDQHDTAWVGGGSGAYRKSMWEKLGGMDTLFNPFYWEDIDLSYRARKAGWTIAFEPESIVHHFHEKGSIKESFTPSEVKQIAYRNQCIFVWKNADMRTLIIHKIFLPYHIIRAIIRNDIEFLKGFWGACREIPAILKHRFSQRKLFVKSDTEVSGTP